MFANKYNKKLYYYVWPYALAHKHIDTILRVSTSFGTFFRHFVFVVFGTPCKPHFLDYEKILSISAPNLTVSAPISIVLAPTSTVSAPNAHHTSSNMKNYCLFRHQILSNFSTTSTTSYMSISPTY
jgi:hypothetical protein